MTERLRIDTPEQVTLELPIAGVGSRFLALVLDTLLQGVLYMSAAAVLFGVVAFRSVLGLSVPILDQLGASWAMALFVFFNFCVYWGYFTIFEIVWKGQTPGKRMTGIRVIKDTGRPLDAYAAIARNLMRVIDFLPGFYAAGVVSMLIDRHSRRLGDFVAGTAVVHDKKTEEAAALELPAAAPQGGTPPIRITPDELVLIETYLQRRPDLTWDVRQQTAGRIAERIARRARIEVPAGQNVDDFLETLSRQARDAARFGG